MLLRTNLIVMPGHSFAMFGFKIRHGSMGEQLNESYLQTAGLLALNLRSKLTRKLEQHRKGPGNRKMTKTKC